MGIGALKVFAGCIAAWLSCGIVEEIGRESVGFLPTFSRKAKGGGKRPMLIKLKLIAKGDLGSAYGAMGIVVAGKTTSKLEEEMLGRERKGQEKKKEKEEGLLHRRGC